MKRNANFILKLIFGLMGLLYSVIGLVFLGLAVKWAGDLCRIFTLPEEHLAFAINGTVFTALGVIFLIVTVILILVGKRRARMREELLTWGSRIKGEVVDVRVDYTVRVNRRSPVIAKVRCTLPSGEITLRSPRLWDAHPAVGNVVEVIYDQMDEKRYVIEFPAE